MTALESLGKWPEFMSNLHPPGGRQPHERFLNVPAVVIIIGLLCFLAYVIPAYLMSYEEEEAFFAQFGFVPVLFATNHDLMTRLSAVTYSFLHGSWSHLGLNMVWFVIFGSPLANRLGAFFFILFWFFTAFAAALAYFILYPDSGAMLVGASGAISGLMGAAARYGFQAMPGNHAAARSGFAGSVLPICEALRSRTVLVFIGGWLLLNVLTGFFNQYSAQAGGSVIAWEAHIGGLLAGFAAIGFFDRRSCSFR